MKDINICTEDSLFHFLLKAELERIGKTVAVSPDESCILLIVDADAEDAKEKLSIPHTFTLGISRDFENLDVKDVRYDAILKRPVSMKELRTSVCELLKGELDKKSDKNEDRDEIILLADRKTLLLNGDKISLTPNEFSLLEYLMKNRGQAVPRNTINELLDADGNTSDVYICMLRKKLTTKCRCPIVTVRGKGYMIE